MPPSSSEPNKADAPEVTTHAFDTLPGVLPAWGRETMPAFPGYWRALGPGIVWMALAQGTGELVFWPAIVAKYGLGFMFLLIPACLLQFPVNYEIGRYTLLTGESIWQGFIRLNRWVAFVMWLLMTVSFMWLGGWVTAGGMEELTGFPVGWTERGQQLFWAYVFMVVFLVALLLSRVVYRTIERVMTVVALVTLVGLVLACLQPAVLSKLGEFGSGLVRPRWPADRTWDNADATVLLTAITFAGLGGFWTLFYSYWLREKNVGMAGRIGRITSPITGRQQHIPSAGYLPTRTAEDVSRWLQWKRFLRIDNGVGIVGNLIRIMPIRLPMDSALCKSCVTTTPVMPIRPRRSLMRSSILRDVTGSSPDVGSSYKTISGRRMMARARPTRFCIPPDRSAGNFSAASRKLTSSSVSNTFSSISSSLMFV